jgi:putative membrane protein
MERIKNTPLPIHHQVLPRLFTHLFCLVLPFSLLETLGEMTPLGSSLAGLVFLAILRIGDDLAEPFGGRPHDVPVDTLARTIEINLPASIGCDTPSPLPTSRGVAW